MSNSLKTFVHKIDEHFAREHKSYDLTVSERDAIYELFQAAACDQLILWKEKKSNITYLGVGEAHLIQDTKELQRSSSQLKDNEFYFGGCFFDEHQQDPNDIWQAFSSTYFIKPAYVVKQEGTQLSIYKQLTHHKSFASFFSFESRESGPNKATEKETNPTPSQWHNMIDHALKAMEKEGHDKVVLSVQTTLKLQGPSSPQQTFMALKRKARHTYEFYLQSRPGHVFLSFSPETLYQKEERRVFIDAIAGTRARSVDAPTDEQLGRDLLASEKDQREHALVVEHIQQDLQGLGPIKCESQQLLKLSHVQHLYTPMTLQLTEDASALQLIDYLHPTPAVGGSPRAWAQKFIRVHESYPRGFYAGPIGCLHGKREEFAVGIRSALFTGDEVHLFGGCGIVAGSDAAEEWQEALDKVKPFREVL